MDEEAVRAALQHYVDYSATDEDVAHEIYHRVRGGGDLWVVELLLRYDGGPWKCGVDILEFRGDKVSRESAYSMEAWEAPEWRARRRTLAVPDRSRGSGQRRPRPAYLLGRPRIAEQPIAAPIGVR
jgi:hypothetical protein